MKIRHTLLVVFCFITFSCLNKEGRIRVELKGTTTNQHLVYETQHAEIVLDLAKIKKYFVSHEDDYDPIVFAAMIDFLTYNQDENKRLVNHDDNIPVVLDTIFDTINMVINEEIIEKIESELDWSTYEKYNRNKPTNLIGDAMKQSMLAYILKGECSVLDKAQNNQVDYIEIETTIEHWGNRNSATIKKFYLPNNSLIFSEMTSYVIIG